MVTPPDPAGTVARLAAAMRQLSGEAAATQRQQAASRRGDRAKDPAASSTASTSGPDWANTLQARLRSIGAIEPDPERRRRAASRLIIESLLVQELGSELVADAGFQAVIDDVLAAMEGAPGMRADLDRVALKLLRDDGQ